MAINKKFDSSFSKKKVKKSNIEKGKLYSFKGVNKLTQESAIGYIRAKDERDARRKLAYKNIQVINIEKEKRRREKRISQTDITLFARQMTSMLKAGLPMLQAIDIVSKGYSNPSMTQLLNQVKSEVEQGNSLSNAFSNHPKYFDYLFCGLVEAGEVGGVLDIMFDKLATYKERMIALRKKVVMAMIYPVSIIVVAFAVLTIMMIWVLPRFKSIYEGLGATLPTLTQKVMDVSDFFVAYILWVLLAIFIFIFILRRWYKNSDQFRYSADQFLLKIPLLGTIIYQSIIARWGRTFSILYAAGVPMTESLDLVGIATGNLVYQQATDQIKLQVSQGETLTSSLRSKNHLFPIMFIQLVEVGEESGSLDDMTLRSAVYYEEEVDSKVSTLTTLMEPIIIVVLGVMVGIILLALYLPLFDIGNAVG